MKSDRLVSVALCAYNGEKYLSQQLDSILRQTHKNLELVIVDDCSKDNTFEIIKDCGKKDARIRCFKNETIKGFNKNFEYAISLTTGGYIAISDQDDIWLPNKLEKLLSNIKNNWLIFSNSSYINKANEPVKGKILETFKLKTSNFKNILLANFVTGHTALFDRASLKYLLPFPKTGFYDWWIGFVCLCHKKIAFLDEVLTKYCIHDVSVTQQLLNLEKAKQTVNETIENMLSSFATYKELAYCDKVFIEELKNAYILNLSSNKPIPLIKIIFKHYTELFPNGKKRNLFSLLNFALKYARKVKK